MTLTEYQRRLANLMSSDAPPAIKEKAIKDLRERFDPTIRTKRVHQQIAESQADYSDMGGPDS